MQMHHRCVDLVEGMVLQFEEEVCRGMSHGELLLEFQVR